MCKEHVIRKKNTKQKLQQKSQ